MVLESANKKIKEFDNGPFSYHDNVLPNHGGLPHVVLLGVHLEH